MASPVSIGDVIEITRLAWRITLDYKNAPGDRKELVERCNDIHTALEPIDEEQLNEMLEMQTMNSLRVLFKGLEATLKEVDKFLERYQSMSGFAALLRRSEFAVLTKRQRGNFLEQLQVHLQALHIAISGAGLQGIRLIWKQMQVLVKINDTKAELASEVEDAFEGGYRKIDKTRSNGLSQTQTLQSVTDVQTMEPLIRAYSEWTGIDIGKDTAKRAATLAITQIARTSISHSAAVKLTLQSDPNAPGSSPSASCPKNTPSQTGSTPTTGPPSPHTAPEASRNDVRLSEERQRRKEWEHREEQQQQRYGEQQRREEQQRQREVAQQRREDQQRQRDHQQNRREERQQQRDEEQEHRDDQQRQRHEEQEQIERKQRQCDEQQRFREQRLRREERELLERRVQEIGSGGRLQHLLQQHNAFQEQPLAREQQWDDVAPLPLMNIQHNPDLPIYRTRSSPPTPAPNRGVPYNANLQRPFAPPPQFGGKRSPRRANTPPQNLVINRHRPVIAHAAIGRLVEYSDGSADYQGQAVTWRQ